MSEDRPRDRLDDEEVLKRLGAALRADHAEIDAADDSSMPAPSAALRARVLAAAEAEVFGAPKEITRLRPPARRAPLAAAAFVLVAAAASFALWGRAPAGDLAIPPYEAELATADVDTRGAEGTAGAPLHVSGERFVLVVRPKVAPSGPVHARAFLFRAGAPLPWNPPLDVGPEGVVRIAGKRSEILPAGEGDLEVVIAIGSAERLPADAEVARRAVASPTAGFRAVSLHFAQSP